ncbi:centrosomal protein of 120 kDa-like isoform X3 [Amphiura filiformis]|uniref:centrosomal protein of 120 kDa-like isoform X3 n=1 Tax=Amphiura filiformis TaxID=82378 RepID=UPI003B228458
MSKEQYLVVVSILDGRKFPKRGKHQLVVETRFDGEHLATDPVSHGEAPEFNTELAWELSKKALHQHRLQRTPIKLQCYAVDQFSQSKENIGYIMLDLRTAAFLEPSPAKVPVTSKWYPLLSTKYSRHKPELKIGISLETDAQGQDQSFKAKSAPPRKGQAPDNEEEYPEDPETDLRYLQPILHDTDGYYQIGPPDLCTESFVLSITIAYAAHLAQLVPSDRPLPAQDSGFFFYYSLFGNDVTNEAFRDLLNPNFAAERASVRLRSSIRALYAFLMKESIFQVNLCSGDKSLGSADIPFTSLLVQDTSAINRHPLTVEGSFRLVPPALVQQKLPPVDASRAPCVGVSVALRREEMPLPTGGLKQPSVSQPTPSQPELPTQQPPQPSTPPRQQKPSKKTVSPHDSPPEKLARPATKHPDVSLTSLDNGSGTEGDVASIEDEEEDGGRKHRQGKYTGASEPHRPATDSKATQPQKQTPPHQGAKLQTHPPQREGESTSTSSHAQVVVDAAAHHFSFSIDLRLIKDVVTGGALNIYLRYSYPFFGSSAPIMTHPPVEVRKHTEVLLPHSFCAFDFATTPHQLHETLFRVPLLVEVWHRDSYSKDVLLGIARVSLAGILQAEKARVASAHVGGPEGWRQICRESACAETTEGKPVQVAELMVVLGLEDFGPIRAQQIIVGADKSQTSTSASARAPPPPPLHPDEPVEPPDPRETAEYKAAMELEMWKEQQAGHFEHELKEKELQYMQSLAEEWKRRDREREILVKKKVDEYNHLEDQLRNALADIDKRERQLAANESEVVRLRQDLQREHDHQLTELKEASRRMKEDCVHQVQIEKSKVHLLEEEKQRLAEQLAEAQQQLQRRDQEFQEFRRQLSSKPEVKLQSELNLLTLEKVELERKLESVTKSKIHYKQQWGRALKELARLKQREHTEAQARLKRQQQELEHMRLRYLAAEEKEVVKSERKELEDIKGELDRLKQQEQNKQQQPNEITGQEQRDAHRTAHTTSQQKENIEPDMHNLDSSMDEHVARLIEERDTLLRTGVYTHQDRIITELDRQIREAITTKGTS